MNNSIREQIGCDVICKSHSARTERDIYRICPSKLSKRELEDLYFALLENNLELKKTINVQQDKIKVLSTRLQRMTVVHKNVAGKEKDCCASKAVVSEQKESLNDLKKTNERMAERIRLLNMKLCSAKQFLKRSPLQSTNSNKICTRCTFKNSSMSALNAKRSDSNMRTTTVSCQFLEKDVAEQHTRAVETETEVPEKEDSEKLCNENKCRTMMDELKENIVNLQEELATSHNEYSKRIAALESQVSQLSAENLRVRSDHVTSEHALQERVKKADRLQEKLRTADAKCNELNMELSIEKRKVAELETGLKLANLSKHVVETINQLAADKEDKEDPLSELCRTRSCCSDNSQKQRVSSPKQAQLEIPSTSKTKNEVKISTSEDSGYTELNKSCETEDDQAMVKMNRELLKKIADLQSQLDVLRITTAGEVGFKQSKKPKDFESYDAETKDIHETQTENAADPGLILAGEVECKRSKQPKDFESYDVETKDIDEKQTENAQDLGFMLKNTSDEHTEVERDKNSTPGYEEMASLSKPWEEYLNTESNDVNHEDGIDNDNMDRAFDSSATKHKSEARLREDEHNSLQIPGPIPVVNPSQSFTKEKRNYRNTQINKDSYSARPKNKKATSEEKAVKIFESKDSYFNSVKTNESVGGNPKEVPIVAKLKEYARDTGTEHGTKDITEKKQKIVSITDVQAKLAGRTPTRDSIFVNRKKLASQSDMAEVKESTTSFYLDSVCTPPHPSETQEKGGKAEQGTQVQENDDTGMYALCESRATLCRCPVLERRHVAVFRTCSGTLRFRTVTAGDKLRRCACPVPHDSSGTQIDLRPMSKRRDSATYTAEAPNTYTVEVEKRSRATSPDNTEHEISSMTDLPSERDAKSPRAYLSPGEEKATMTYTDTETMATDYGSLSEGEMPPAGGKVRTLSIGETISVAKRTSIPLATSSQKMEATLQSISDELARCRELLLSQRPQEKDSEPREVSPPRDVAVHALRHSAASRSIADVRPPSCVFILHIGTLVLSDESVLFTRDKTLVLIWKFYSQNAAMTRVGAGRVLQFDFVTEYKLAFDGDFINYMKNSDLAIALCELHQQDEPFALCSLPLRQALLHANRRADMSLALIPTSPSSRNSVGDGIGVLDLWCTLRVEVSLLPAIHRAMHTPSPPNWSALNLLRCDSKVVRRAADDEAPSERLSRDLGFSLSSQDDAEGTRSTGPEPQRYNYGTDDEYQATSSIARDPSARYDDDRNVQQNNVTRLPKMDEDASHVHSSIGSVKSLAARHQLSKLRWSKNKMSRERVDSLQELLKKRKGSSIGFSSLPAASKEGFVRDEDSDRALSRINNVNKYNGLPGLNKIVEATKKSVKYVDVPSCTEPEKESSADSDEPSLQSIDVTILWLALNEECEAMVNPKIQRLYVAYSFLGRRGADLETALSLPKPKHYADKCYFNFKKTFHLHECDLPLLGHMSRCRAGGGASTGSRDCIVFSLVSEPPEDPLGLSSCEDIGYAYLYLGDVLAYSGGSSGYTEVLGVRGVRGGLCGVLAVRVDQLPVLRRCLSPSHSHRDLRSGASPSHLAQSSTLPMFQVLYDVTFTALKTSAANLCTIL